MIRLYKKIFLGINLIAGLLGLIGCSGDRESVSNGDYGSAQKWSNYKCFATNGQSSQQYTGWSTSQSKAKDNALDKCRSHGGRCQITHCTGE